MTLRWSWSDPPHVVGDCLDRGGVVAFPTESSYGLGARPGNPVGVDAVYAAKGRPTAKPLPVVAGSIEQLAELEIDLDDRQRSALEAIWPSAVTVILPSRRVWAATAGIAAVAVRVPDHEGLRSLLDAVGPVTATSANRADEPPMCDPNDLHRLLNGHDAVLIDDGVLRGGLPSTIVDGRDRSFRLVRAGRVPYDVVRAAWSDA